MIVIFIINFSICIITSVLYIEPYYLKFIWKIYKLKIKNNLLFYK